MIIRPLEIHLGPHQFGFSFFSFFFGDNTYADFLSLLISKECVYLSVCFYAIVLEKGE